MSLHNSSKFTELARQFVTRWEKQFLQPNPETYIRRILEQHCAGLNEHAGSVLRKVYREAMLSAEMRDAVDKARLPLGKEAKKLALASSVPQEFQGFLNELSLQAMPELEAIKETFSEHAIAIAPSHDSIRADYPDTVQYAWQILFHDRNVATISTFVTNGPTPFAISRLGPIEDSTRDALLLDMYGFLVIVARDAAWHRASGAG